MTQVLLMHKHRTTIFVLFFRYQWYRNGQLLNPNSRNVHDITDNTDTGSSLHLRSVRSVGVVRKEAPTAGKLIKEKYQCRASNGVTGAVAMSDETSLVEIGERNYI